MKRLRWMTACLAALLAALIAPAEAGAQGNPPYTTYRSIADLMVGNDAQSPRLVRISEPGTRESPNYTGFFFYQCLQFDSTDRYVLGMRVHCQNRDVQPTDRAEIGVIDLRNGCKWTQIGETTAWNWQQGARLQWRPGSDEILWNDRSDDGSHYVCRVYDFKTGARRTLPRLVYAPSPDGAVALTHDFERMKHGGTPYVGIKDKYADQYAPKETGIWRMDLSTGEAALIMSLDQMARIAYPDGAPSSGCLYFFREGWNPSGSRFIAFVKDPDNGLDKAFSMTGTGRDVRYFYNRPSHHEWQDDNHIVDGRGYYLYPDDGTGTATNRLFESTCNGHVSYIPRPGGDWIISDTYAIDGYQYLFLYHIPTKQFVPLAKLKSTAPDNIYRVDLHPRLSRSGRIVSIDATHEGLGRQMYMMDIGYILDNPPAGQGQSSQSIRPELFREHLADYDAELRRPDGRVDIDAMVARLKELGVTTYYWLIWHASTDWDDLKLFLPRAAAAGIDVWVYLVPPSESPPKYGSQYSEPFRLDYYRWAEEIARLSLQHANLTAWVIDDFYANHGFFTPAYLREMQARAKRISPRLAFLPLMYFDEIRAKFAEEYREVIDGVVVAYLQDRDEIEWTWAILNDAAVVPPSELSCPWDTPSKAGDFAMASQSAQVLPADRYTVAFRERDDFTGPTSGYHFKQLLVDGVVVWEEDVAGGAAAWRKITLDVTEHVRGRAGVAIAFRLFDKQGVSNFGVRWHLSELRAENLRFVADLAEPGKWKVDRQGPFEAGFGSVTRSGERRFHIPFISMTAGDVHEFQQRHGDPATPERIAEWLRMSLQARRDGKCDGVVIYCLDKRPESPTFPLARELFREFRRHANAQNTSQSWWLAKDLRVVTYEFLERSQRASDLTPDEILKMVDSFGGCDLVLLKGFHYWQGQFDDSSWGYSRFRDLAEKLIPRLHARGIKTGIFGFTDRHRSYADGPDHRRIMEVWKEYVRLGTDILFVDEESGSGGLDIPASCLSHCDELRTTFKLPVGLFLYGPASKAGQVREIARHVDVIGEMGYNLFLDARGDYGLEEVTRQWSQALKGATDRPVVYWTGAMVMLEPGQQPGGPFWRERFSERTLARYFEDYLQRARDSGADGVFFHSLCRFSNLATDTQTEVAAAMKRVFGQVDNARNEIDVPEKVATVE
jgi:hypothetical protein